jgi:hypothetical protein
MLREPFPPEVVGILPKPYKRDSPKSDCPVCGTYHGMPAVHLDYVGHAAVTDRLLTVDPWWSWDFVALDPDGMPVVDNAGGMWITLTIAEVTRKGYGDGPDPKQRIGDAIRNAGMRFGIALQLWTKDELESLIGNEKAKASRRKPPAASTPVQQERPASTRRVPVPQDPETAGKTAMSAADRNKIIRYFSQLDPPVVGDAVAKKVASLLGREDPVAMAKLSVEDGTKLFQTLGLS